MSIETNYMVIQGYTYKEWSDILKEVVDEEDKWGLLTHL